MAKLFPDISNIDRLVVQPTDGERNLLMVLCDSLDDTYEVYFNPYLDGDRPDIIVIKPCFGVWIIEVKDWNINYYKVDMNNQWRYDGKVIRSPQQQVFGYKKNLFDLHLPILGLRHLTNKNFFNVIKVGVYFHCASKNQLKSIYQKALNEIRDNSLRLSNEKIVDYFKYNKIMDRYDRARNNIERDLSMSWGGDTVHDLVRKIKNWSKHPLFTIEIYEDFTRRLRPPLHTQKQGINIPFDTKQHASTMSKPGFAKIKGVAGCGKTTILAQRAINAHARHNSQVLILTFNITLRHYIRDTISLLGKSGEQSHYEIIHYHAFIRSQLNNYGIDIESKKQEMPVSIREDMNKFYGMKSIFDGVEIEKYQTILIDEIQDYYPEWIKLVRDCFLADDGEMVLFGDQSQNIYDRSDDGRDSPIVLGFGSWVKLTKSYRYTPDTKLVELCRNFQIEYLVKKYADAEVIDKKTTQSIINYDLMEYHVYGADYDSIFVFEKIQECIKNYQIHPNDIVLISSKIDYLIPLNREFKKYEKTKVMFEEDEEIPNYEDSEMYNEELRKIRQRKKSFFFQNSGVIKMSTIHSFKGLEAQTVFCIISPDDGAEMIYTGITRAQKNLVVFDYARSKFRNFFEQNMIAAQ